MRHCVKYLVFSLAIVAVVLAIPGRASAQPGVVAHMGTLPDGATYLIEVPVNWNGTLFLYSHGYVVPGRKVKIPLRIFSPSPIPPRAFFMLSSGFALAGSFLCDHRLGYPTGAARPDRCA